MPETPKAISDTTRNGAYHARTGRLAFIVLGFVPVSPVEEGCGTMEGIEKRTVSKVMWRLLPFLIVCYFVAYLDRVNVGFAKLQMNSALGLSEAAYGFGAGLFFIAYFLLEVPSN